MLKGQYIHHVVKVQYAGRKALKIVRRNNNEVYDIIKSDFHKLGFPPINRNSVCVMKPGVVVCYWKTYRPSSLDDRIIRAAEIRDHERDKFLIQRLTSYPISSRKFIPPQEYDDPFSMKSIPPQQFEEDGDPPPRKRPRSSYDSSYEDPNLIPLGKRSTEARYPRRDEREHHRTHLPWSSFPQNNSFAPFNSDATSSTIDLTKEADDFTNTLPKGITPTVSSVPQSPVAIKTEPIDDVHLHDLIDMHVDEDDDNEVDSLALRIHELEQELAEEKERRLRAERWMLDIQREVREPFVVPALLDAVNMISSLATQVCQG